MPAFLPFNLSVHHRIARALWLKATIEYTWKPYDRSYIQEFQAFVKISRYFLKVSC